MTLAGWPHLNPSCTFSYFYAANFMYHVIRLCSSAFASDHRRCTYSNMIYLGFVHSSCHIFNLPCFYSTRFVYRKIFYVHGHRIFFISDHVSFWWSGLSDHSCEWTLIPLKISTFWFSIASKTYLFSQIGSVVSMTTKMIKK